MPKEKLPLTDIEQKAIRALDSVTFLPASFDKRFYNSISGATMLTERQKQYLVFVFNKYRRQIANYEVLAMELDPERFKVDVSFYTGLFNEADIKITDTFKPTRHFDPPPYPIENNKK